MFRRRSRFAVLLGAITLVLGLPTAALANTGFRVTADRAGVVQGATSSVGVTITPEIQADVDNRCYGFQPPAAFVMHSVQITAAPSGSNWSADLQAGRVRLRANGDSLIEAAERLSAAIAVTGTAPGAYTWTVDGYADGGCGGPSQQRFFLMSITPAAPTPPPTPQPTPAPTPAPTPRPPTATPPPTAAPPGGQPGDPAPGPSSTTGLPSSAQQSGPPGNSSPSPSGTDQADPAGGGPPGQPPQTPGQGAGTDGQTAATLRPADAGDQGLAVFIADAGSEGAGMETQISSSVFSAMAMLDNVFEWFVPGLTVGVPGMLILAVLGAQMLGGFIFLPAVRRTMREDRLHRRPLRPAWL